MAIVVLLLVHPQQQLASWVPNNQNRKIYRFETGYVCDSFWSQFMGGRALGEGSAGVRIGLTLLLSQQEALVCLLLLGPSWDREQHELQ